MPDQSLGQPLRPAAVSNTDPSRAASPGIAPSGCPTDLLGKTYAYGLAQTRVSHLGQVSTYEYRVKQEGSIHLSWSEDDQVGATIRHRKPGVRLTPPPDKVSNIMTRK